MPLIESEIAEPIDQEMSAAPIPLVISQDVQADQEMSEDEEGDIMDSEINMALLPTPAHAPTVQHQTPAAETSSPELNVTNKCYMFDYGKQMSRLMSFTEE